MSAESAAPVVVIDAGHPDGIARCLQALVQNTDAGVTLVLGGQGEARAAAAELLAAASRSATVIEQDGARLWNAARELHPSRPLVILDGATEVVPGWLEALTAVWSEHADAASATPLSNAAAFLSVPRRNLPWPLLAEHTPAAVASKVAETALRIHPRIPTALPHCALLPVPALQRVGGFDDALASADALADWCARATSAGLVHLAADELVVGHRGDLSGWRIGGWPGKAGEKHPALRAAVSEVAEARHSPLARALLAASVAIEPLAVTVDARCLSATQVTGTVVHVVELLGALCERGDVRVRALLPETIAPVIESALGRIGGLERTTVAAQDAEASRTQVVHRPWQVDSTSEMEFLDRLGERTVITNQDLIGYRTPAVFDSPESWLGYRRATRDALALAAGVVCFSDAAADDLRAEDIVEPDRLSVVPLGATPKYLVGEEESRPAGLTDESAPFLLMIGNRFQHKNVGFALGLLGALRSTHGWEGRLVLAGADVLHGSSSADDAAWTLRNSAHADAVTDLGAISEAEKRWLMRRAAAVVYPSTYEGFGLVPFEAASLGTPCLFASVSSLRENLDPSLALIEPWDVAKTAERVAPILVDEEARTDLVSAQLAAGQSLSWATTAASLVDAYRAALRAPAPSSAGLLADLARTEHDYWRLRDQASSAVWHLVDPDGELLDEDLADQLAHFLRQPDGPDRLRHRLSRRHVLPFRPGG